MTLDDSCIQWEPNPKNATAPHEVGAGSRMSTASPDHDRTSTPAHEERSPMTATLNDDAPYSRIVETRAAIYGDPRINIERTAALWSAWLGVPVTGHDVGWMFVLAKGSRSKVDPTHGDNYVDGKGYIDIAEGLA